MGDEDDDGHSEALNQLEVQILALKKQLESLLQQKASILKSAKRPAPSDSGRNPNGPPKRKKLESPVMDVAANEEVESVSKESEKEDHLNVKQQPNKENEPPITGEKTAVISDKKEENEWMKVQRSSNLSLRRGRLGLPCWNHQTTCH